MDSYSEDPMDTDDWLRISETKLDFTNCNDEECVALAVHQLEGPAKSWWDSYWDSHADPAHISWEEFARAFRDQHVPKQVLVQKAQEFRTMSQGTMKVEEYERHFMKMMRHAADDTNTEEKKQFWFHHGLHHGIRHMVAGCEFTMLRHMVNRCIAIEKERLGWEDRQCNKKRRADQQICDCSLQKPRGATPPPSRNNYHPSSNPPNRGFGGGNHQYNHNMGPSPATSRATSPTTA